MPLVSRTEAPQNPSCLGGCTVGVEGRAFGVWGLGSLIIYCKGAIRVRTQGRKKAQTPGSNRRNASILDSTAQIDICRPLYPDV